VSDQPERQMSEEEIRAIEAEIDRINVDDVVLQTIVSLINLGARKGAVGAPPEAGLAPDYEQLRVAIEAARALVGVVEPRHGDQLAPIRDALSQLQMAYARNYNPAHPGAAPAGEPAGGTGQDAPPEAQGGQAGPGPAQRSGKLWIPGQ
jgi:hypothetical protein